MDIKVSGIDYKVLNKTAEEMGGHIGLANFNTQEIWIHNDMTQQTKVIARWHETVHILEKAYGVKMSEEQVTIFTHALVSLLRDNPNIVDQFNND